MNIKKTADLLINFVIKRLAEIFGIMVFVLGALLFLALLTYSPEDPNFIFPDNIEIKNLLGFQGSFVSDLFFQSIGLTAYLISLTYMMTGINIFRIKEFFFYLIFILKGLIFI
jgi:DNA segregation ATPase FtsK/SpoIIIE, S-DNA-T family